MSWDTPLQPAWNTARGLRAATALYAVFLAGWWLGKPVLSDACFEDPPAAGAGSRPASMEPAAPGRYFGNVDLDFGLLDLLDGLDGSVDGAYGPSDWAYGPRVGEAASGADHDICPHRKRARLVAWVNGDWR
ncbi:hypothetical protein [Streptomyces sp. NPDC056600]|uniref:hypothetical protein n=1 Tax=Streptomyces sp. NPDC056600 TaxID=3345874 RepID=UPI003689927C